MFHVGQKVVCVVADPHAFKRRSEIVLAVETWPTEGQIYTIREIRHNNPSGRPGFILHEIKNPLLDYVDGRGELAFRAERFRPLVSTDTGMSILRELLANPNKKIKDDTDPIKERQRRQRERRREGV